MTRFYIVAKVPVMLQYEKAAVSNSAFKGDVVYYDDVKESERATQREADEWAALASAPPEIVLLQ